MINEKSALKKHVKVMFYNILYKSEITSCFLWLKNNTISFLTEK